MKRSCKCAAFSAFVLTVGVLSSVFDFDSFLFLHQPKCQRANTISNTNRTNYPNTDTDTSTIASVLSSDLFLDRKTCTYTEGLDATPGGRLRWLNPESTDQLLADHNVLVIGDSLMRRLCAHVDQFRRQPDKHGTGVPFKFTDPGGHRTIVFESKGLTFNWNPNVKSKILRLRELLAANKKKTGRSHMM